MLFSILEFVAGYLSTRFLSLLNHPSSVNQTEFYIIIEYIFFPNLCIFLIEAIDMCKVMMCISYLLIT